MNELGAGRDSFVEKLSPDLKVLFEQAEKFIEESLFKKAYLVFKKIETYLPDEPYILNRMTELLQREKISEGPVAEGSLVTSSIQSESDGLLVELLRTLELENIRGTSKGLEIDFSSIETLANERFKHIALDAALMAGVSENWHLSLRLTEKLLTMDDDSLRTKLWKLRCLVEVERFPEAVALFGAIRWSHELMLHANFLAGLAYEGLGVREQAQSRFEAVYKVDPNYRKVAQKLLNI